MEHDPQCIGIIMDGNRRWSRLHNLPTYEGHRIGYEKLKNVLEWMKEAGIKNAIIYALSTENLQRVPDEVSYLLDLFRMIIREQVERAGKEGVRVAFAGKRELFPEDIQEMIADLEERTKENGAYHLVVAAPYGGRAELVAAANRAVERGDEVTEEDFGNLLWTHPFPDPDLIIRSGGEKRLSNFLPWQATYSELFFSDTLWPDFTRDEFDAIVAEYRNRERRYGK